MVYVHVSVYLRDIYLFTYLFPILYPSQDRPSGLGLHGFSLSQVYQFISFILRLYYLEWRLLFLKLSSCETSILGNVRLKWKNSSVVSTEFEETVSVDKKNQLDVTFCILYFSSNSCSTCFGQPCAHHQELTTA